jgi:hypothetical protein
MRRAYSSAKDKFGMSIKMSTINIFRIFYP